MGSSCKGICVNFKAAKIANRFRYDIGQKRCSYCAIYMQVDSINCPCCGSRLRSKARHRQPTRTILD